MNYSGNIQWQKRYGIAGWNYGFAIQPTSDAGYITASYNSGTIYSNDMVQSDTWILKMTSAGELVPSCTFINDTSITPVDITASLVDTSVTPSAPTSSTLTSSFSGVNSSIASSLVCNCIPPSGISNNTAVDLDSCTHGIQVSWAVDPSSWGDTGSSTSSRTYDLLRNGVTIATDLPYGTNNYIDTTGSSGTSYTFQIKYKNGCALVAVTQGAIAEDSFAVAPSGLTNNTAQDIDSCTSGIRVTWTTDPTSWGDNNVGTRTYDILRNGTAIATGITYGNTLYVDTTGSQGTSYTYTVRYKNGCNLSAITPGASATDAVGAAPSGLTNNTAIDVDSCADTGVQIIWSADPTAWGDNNIGTRTYDVLRDGVPIATGLTYGTTTYTDLSGTHGVTYTYSVRYQNGCGLYSNTNPGATAEDNIDTIPCGTVGNTLMVEKVGSNAILTWANVACADLAYYKIYGSNIYDAPFPSGWTVVGTPVTNTFTVPWASNAVAFRIVTVDACSNESLY